MKMRLMINILLVLFIFFLLLDVNRTNADTIILKNGQEVVVEMAWEEGDFIKGSKPDGFVGFPKALNRGRTKLTHLND